MSADGRTKYQRTHRPTRVVEVLCVSRKPLTSQGYCPDCGRWLSRSGWDHKPNVDGTLGFVEYYADGSTHKVQPTPEA